ncbi:MAG: hypothetical protein P8R36_00210 [Actinomycetota bacterium]|nr:hypothetical protein [Actinomycetota bacterium]MDG1488688.1 hypothetical protein [Actinomycetota bacterium]MDG2121559.1 hypothetical protein [Actinomycetota bacterium]
MTLPPSDILKRLADTIRNDIGPAVSDEYTRTQAFMASVILTKLSKQLDLELAHRLAEKADIEELKLQLQTLLNGSPPPVQNRLNDFLQQDQIMPLTSLLTELHEWGLHNSKASDALELIRPVLRADIDRRMEIAT